MDLKQLTTDEDDSAFPIDRILVALDNARHSMSALELAATLAAQLQKELQTIFVEDLNLIHLAGLPFAREIDRMLASAREFDRGEIDRSLRAQVETVRNTLTEVTTRLRIPSSLQVVRGYYVNEALAAANTADILFLSRFKQTPTPHKPPQRTAIAVLYNGTTAAGRALLLSQNLARFIQNDLVIFLTGIEDEAGKRLKAKATQYLGEKPQALRYIGLTHVDPGTLSRQLQELHCNLLIIPRAGSELPDSLMRQLVEQIDCPMVLVP